MFEYMIQKEMPSFSLIIPIIIQKWDANIPYLYRQYCMYLLLSGLEYFCSGNGNKERGKATRTKDIHIAYNAYL